MREALRAGRPLDRILITKGATGARIQEIVDLARERRVPVRFEAREMLDRAAMGVSHQGVVAFGAAERFATLEETIAAGGMHVVLDLLAEGMRQPSESANLHTHRQVLALHV